jgi:hypothetical protein
VRVDWVHPSWRDLVIGELASTPEERHRFLRSCGVNGASLALSSAGGAEGAVERPLLCGDADWDALGDGLHALCGNDIDEPEAILLLRALADVELDAEAENLIRLVLKRLGWSGKAISVDAIGAWTAVSARLDPPPEPPAVAMTWLELEPAAAPRTPTEMEQMSDWLRLAELLHRHDPELLDGLGFPQRYAAILADFATSAPVEEPPAERDLRIEALARLAGLDDELANAAMNESLALSVEVVQPATEASPVNGGFPVERVLRDL